MRIATTIALFGLMLLGTAFAGDDGNGCKLQGTWYSVATDNDSNSFVVQYYGTGDTEGTDDSEWVKIGNAWKALGIARLSNTRGLWKKTGPNTYSSVLLTFLYDAEGQLMLISRNYGVKKLIDCNTMEYRGTFTEYLNLYMNVFFSFPDDPTAPPTIAHRMVD